jgi:hypothetical protein
MTTDTAEQDKLPEGFQASIQSNGFTAIYTDQNHESMADETLIATLYDDRWKNIFLVAPALLTMLETAFDILERIGDLLLYEDGLPVTALDAREIEAIYADAISELAPIETLIRKARGQA